MRKILTKLCLFFYFFITNILCYAQKTIGQPDIINFYHELINSGSQNWSVNQDKFGTMYFANNSGLLTYNGSNWKMYRLPNKTIVRAINIGEDMKIYVGGQDAIGYFFPNENGVLKYYSLLKKIPNNKRRFGDVWNITRNKNQVFFRTGSYIYRFDEKNNQIDILNSLPSSSWSFMEVCKEKLYAQNNEDNLVVLNNDNQWVKISSDLLKHTAITAILPFDNNKNIIFTLQHGAFLQSNSGIEKFPINKILINSQIFCVKAINNNLYAIGTISNGIFIINKSGEIIKQFNGENGLQNNNVLSLFIDKNNLLWAGLDEGIALIDIFSPFQKINSYSKTIVPSYNSLIYNNNLYIGTSDGVYYSPLSINTSQDISNSTANYSKISNSYRQVWSLFSINNILLMGHHNGTYILSKNAEQIKNAVEGCWIFRKIPKSKNIIIGTYEGIKLLQWQSNGYIIDKLSKNNINEPLRFIEIDTINHIVWASHPYRGIYKIELNRDYTTISKTTLYTQKDGLPDHLNNFVFKIKDEIIFTTEKGIFEYDVNANQFKASKKYNKLFGNILIKFIVTDTQNRVWFATEKEVGVVENGVIKYFPELKNKLIAGFENIYPYNSNNILFQSHKGIIHLNFENYKKRFSEIRILLNKVVTSGSKDSVLFDGYFEENGSISSFQSPKAILKLPANFNSYHFEYSTDRYSDNENILYSYQLKGYDERWSDWSTKTSKDYTNIPFGKYTFLIKSKDNLGNNAKTISYSFEILPKWYQTKFAYFLYCIGVFLSILLVLHIHNKRLLRQRNIFLAKQSNLKYIHELELEKHENEIVKLKNDQLEADMKHKNKELASTTIHLYKRGKLLSRIKEEINNAILVNKLNREKIDLSKVLRLISQEEKQETNWDQFSMHFDEVHNKFLQKIRSQYPELSPGDLKLCAYLRMNLSSKEIAQLMNFSIKGIENGRYRLRKKFGLGPKESLTNFILSFE